VRGRVEFVVWAHAGSLPRQESRDASSVELPNLVNANQCARLILRRRTRLWAGFLSYESAG